MFRFREVREIKRRESILERIAREEAELEEIERQFAPENFRDIDYDEPLCNLLKG